MSPVAFDNLLGSAIYFPFQVDLNHLGKTNIHARQEILAGASSEVPESILILLPNTCRLVTVQQAFREHVLSESSPPSSG